MFREHETLVPKHPEEEKNYTSRIILFFRRHGQKEKTKEDQSDKDVQLTPIGRKQAMDKANPISNVNQALAYGSPRVRSQQTAGFEMAGFQEEITGEETYEELKAKLDKDRGYGTKLHQDIRLDFPEQEGSSYLEKVNQVYDSGNYLRYLVNESDRDAKAMGDEYSYTYSRAAAGVAQIFEKYIKAAKAWDGLVQGGGHNEQEYSDTLERYFGSHAGILESFLAKVIEMTKGKKERDKFIEALGNQSFDAAEGFDAEIQTSENDEPVLKINYKKEKDGQVIFEYSETVPLNVIKSISNIN